MNNKFYLSEYTTKINSLGIYSTGKDEFYRRCIFTICLIYWNHNWIEHPFRIGIRWTLRKNIEEYGSPWKFALDSTNVIFSPCENIFGKYDERFYQEFMVNPYSDLLVFGSYDDTNYKFNHFDQIVNFTEYVEFAIYLIYPDHSVEWDNNNGKNYICEFSDVIEQNK